VRWVAALVLVGCGRGEPATEGPLPVESAIAHELTARFHAPVTARCTVVAGVPVACRAALDGVQLPVAVAGRAWRLVGRFVETAPIAAYVQGVLADLGVTQHASCGPRVQTLMPGARVVCTLSSGGAAFVDVARDGSLALELALDRSAASARGEDTTADRERDLERRSRELDPCSATLGVGARPGEAGPCGHGDESDEAQ